jgi:hypothetical protein
MSCGVACSKIGEKQPIRIKNALNGFFVISKIVFGVIERKK